MCAKWKNYLFWFAQEHVNFRLNEILSISAALNIEIRSIFKNKVENPFWIVQLANDEAAKRITNRSVLLRHCLYLWSFSLSGDFKEFRQQLHEFSDSEHFRTNFANLSFRINIDTYGNRISRADKTYKMNAFEFLPLKGPIDLTNYQMQLQFIEYYGQDPNNVPDKPYEIFFGTIVCDGGRRLIHEFNLKTRKFIGNTSMDAQLSFLMANQAQIKANDLVLDPFVGSGSLMVSCARFGAYVLGSDYDCMMIRAKCRPSRINQKERDKDESIYANLKQYNLENRYVDVIINDFARSAWSDANMFDAIVTDPPYGLREASKKIGQKTRSPDRKKSPLANQVHTGPVYPSKVRYDLSKLFADLLDFASRNLKVDGKLVFWYPILKRNTLTEDDIPQHPNLELIGNSLQFLNSAMSRYLLTYRKK